MPFGTVRPPGALTGAGPTAPYSIREDKVLKRMKTMLAAGLCLAALAGPGTAQPYPNQPVRIVIPYGPGGGTDTLYQIIRRALDEALGGTTVAEYAGGAATLIGTQRVRAADPDGYTLLLNTSAIALNTIMLPDRPYTMDDFEIIGPVAEFPYMLLANDSQPFSDLAGLIEYARAHPGDLNYAHLGTASPTRLLAERVARSLEVEFTPVAYPGSGPAQPDFYANRTQLQMSSASRQYVEGPNTQVIAVSAAERIPLLPDTPTFAELGYPDVVGGTWFGLFAPKGTPEDVLAHLRSALATALEATRAELEASGHYMIPVSDQHAFRAYIDADLARWRGDLEALGEPVY